ncbi:MAG: purine/pyrimidine permease [Gammaproteobacteria bacterium]|nr:purine/pyrimidine permease [Gammaproteobacteria bacterium]
MRKPPNILYGVDEAPPHAVTLLSGLQHAGLMSINLVYPVLVAHAAGASATTAAAMVSLTMVALAIGALLQANVIASIGSGYLCQPVPTVIYLLPSLLAVKEGGLPLVFGMTVAAGLFQAILARALRHVRPLFPPEIAGLVVLMIGIASGLLGLRMIFGGDASEAPVQSFDVALAFATLAIMAVLSVWGSASLRMVCVLIGMVVGYVIAAAAGQLAEGDLAKVAEGALVALPSFGHLGLDVDVGYVVPFAIAAIAATLKVTGNVTTSQKANDADWSRADMRSVSRGALADGLATAVAGALGSQGVNSSTMNVGLAGGTGVQSRRVAYAVAGIFLLLALTPKIGLLLYLMPRPVAGAALVFASTFILVNGFQIMTSRMLDNRRTLVVGLALLAAFAAELYPQALHALPAGVQAVLGSSLVVVTVIALALNLVFRLGVRQTVSLVVEPGVMDGARIVEFMNAQGAAWGARPDVIDRAVFNLQQSVETLVSSNVANGPLELEASFDEFNLDVRISYDGAPLELPEKRPSIEEIMASEEGERRLAGFMLRRFADRVAATHKAGRSTVLFHFDH